MLDIPCCFWLKFFLVSKKSCIVYDTLLDFHLIYYFLIIFFIFVIK